MKTWIATGMSVWVCATSWAAPQGEFTGKMRELQQTLALVMADVTSDARFSNLKATQGLDASVAKLAKLAREVHSSSAPQGGAPDKDASVRLIASLFLEQTTRAADEIKRGHRSYARSLLRNVPGYCISCHTRQSAGPQNVGTPEAVAKVVKGFSPYERAWFAAATRQTDEAVAQFDAILGDAKSLSERPIDWEKSARYAMALSARVKNDASKTLEIADRVAAMAAAPRFLKEDAVEWKKAAMAWKAEPGRSAETEEGLLAESKRLMAAGESQQKFPADRSGDVYFLRATSSLHSFLNQFPESKHAAEVFYLLGVAYSALQDLHLWSLHELYFEACIRKAPNSELARQGYERLEQSIYMGYSGSGGTSLPPDVRKKLEQLESLAGAKD